MLPSLDARGKESGKRPRESQDSAWALRVEGPERRQPRQVGENGVGALAPATARCEVGLVGLLRGRSRRMIVHVVGLYGPECGLSSGPALRAFGSRGLGVSTFPWGRVTDTREGRSRHLSFYDPKVEGG
ncbi:hypothetical protein CRG98_030195 [Punica granatum]|uniref:Uncharacterized protein n=1 Tax=Punica granatum TaxID=22663 RepID=A0A2I0J0F0_PUNGR|nr:hypothetical protein CRG98_030195 [Punica granatum]